MKKTFILFGICMMLLISSVSLSANAISKSKNVTQTNNFENYDGTLSGYVTDEGMNPIQGALICVNFHGIYEEDYSDENGHYFVDNIPICYCYKNVSCSKEGYKTEYVEMPIYENSTYDFVLENIGGTLTIDGVMGENGWYISGIQIKFSYDPSIVEAVYFQIDNSDWILYTELYYFDELGVHELWYYFVLVSGGTSDMFGPFDLKIDWIRPYIDDVTIETINSDTYRISADVVGDDVSGIDYVKFYLDGDLIDVLTEGPYEVEVTVSEKGTHILRIVAYDIAGNLWIYEMFFTKNLPVLRNFYIFTVLINLLQRFNLI